MDAATLYQDLIIDHGTQPRNYKVLAQATHSAEGFNPLCGDRIQVYLILDGDKIQTASFQGSGCAICTASASLMTEALNSQVLEDTDLLCQQVQDLLTLDGTPAEGLGKLMALSGVKAYPSRVKCASLAWHTLKAALKSHTDTISTE